ncbi:hypothetical protein [Dehalococcoides sp.]|uniref:hypothetical protein n=1 Tax=Dehalococcoides sp. TaxID=1966486 RepID=UPI002ACB1458|nr:hypothetical protein [Dehalococcoides sp.]
MGVSIGFKRSAASRAKKVIDRLAVHGFGVCLPPSHTTPIGAESFVLRPRRVNERTSAVGTDILNGMLFLYCAYTDIVPAAVRLDGVF